MEILVAMSPVILRTCQNQDQDFSLKSNTLLFVLEVPQDLKCVSDHNNNHLAVMPLHFEKINPSNSVHSRGLHHEELLTC